MDDAMKRSDASSRPSVVDPREGREPSLERQVWSFPWRAPRARQDIAAQQRNVTDFGGPCRDSGDCVTPPKNQYIAAGTQKGVGGEVGKRASI